MRIAILGTRGIPANYGGFETFAEELGVRLAERGHRVTVYGRAHHVPDDVELHRGVHLVVLPTIRHKYLDTIVHTGISAIHALGTRYDAILLCNAANALFAGLLRLGGLPVVLNVDGIERRRRKWNALGRAWYAVSERLATILPNAIVTDARAIQRYYRERYGAESTFISYGSELAPPRTRWALERFGLEPGRYVLYVSRLEPENNADAVIAGYDAAPREWPLVIVGAGPYSPHYVERLRQMAGPSVIFTGAVYGDGYRELQEHAAAYIHATEVGGTHPALVEAMGRGHCVIVNDVPENREVAGDAAVYFDVAKPESLSRALDSIVSDPRLARRLGNAAAHRARRLFSWDAVTDEYERLFIAVTSA